MIYNFALFLKLMQQTMSFFIILTWFCLLMTTSDGTVLLRYNSTIPTLVWTGYNPATKTYSFNFWKANPVLDAGVGNQTIYPSFSMKSSSMTSKLNGLLADSQRQRILVSDWLSNVIGEFSFSAGFNSSSLGNFYRLDSSTGMINFVSFAEGLINVDELFNLPFTEAIEIDWKTNNIYYTKQNIIYIIKNELNYYVTVPVNVSYRIRAFALHPVKRLLFFSTFGDLTFSRVFRRETSNLFRSDLSGFNPQVLLSPNQTNDVRGVVVNYLTDRLYFIDVSATISRVRSCNFDGENLIDIFDKTNFDFQSIASYENKLYVSGDQRNGDATSKLWIIKIADINNNLIKPAEELVSFSLNITILALSILATNQTRTQADAVLGSCAFSNRCDQICLPRVAVERNCACATGFIVNGTSCIRATNTTDSTSNTESTSSDAGLLLFIILIPVCAIIILIALYIRHRRNDKKFRRDSSLSDQHAVLEQRNSNNEECSPRTRPYSTIEQSEMDPKLSADLDKARPFSSIEVGCDAAHSSKDPKYFGPSEEKKEEEIAENKV